MTSPVYPSRRVAAEEALDSWKEIAAYLGRSVRTVQTWEKEEGLPVHRHQHDKQGSVHAFRDEIDRWRAGRTSVAPQPPVSILSRPGVAALAGGSVLIVLIVVVLMRDSGAQAVAVTPFPRGSLLVAALENRSGQPAFDGSIEYLLERELAESNVLSVVSVERVVDALRLMKAPADAPLDRQRAREVALRDGNVDAIVATRLERVGAIYVLGADLIDVGRGDRLLALKEEASSERELPAMVRRLARRIRTATGELAVTDGRNDLEKVTTPSLRALQFFTRADRLISLHNDAVAESLLEEAIAEDADFAMAHIYLAFARRNQGKPPESYLPPAARAAELAALTTERERYFILGSHALMNRRVDEAVAYYKTLLRIDPNHFWATSVLGGVLKFDLERPVEAAPLRIRMAQLRPNEMISNFAAAESLDYWLGRREDALPYYRRALELATVEDEEKFPLPMLLLRTHAVRYAWLDGDAAGLIAELQRLEEQKNLRRSDALLEAIGYYSLAAGREAEAIAIASRIESRLIRSRYQARLTYWRGDLAGARERYREHFEMAGQVTNADRLRAARSGYSPGRDSNGPDALMKAAASERRGDPDEAIMRYREFLHRNSDPSVRSLPLQLAALEGLASALSAEGNVEEAADAIERMRGYRHRIPPEAVPQWELLERLAASIRRPVAAE